ncbi:MAG: carbonic anhydrase [Polynucleobacter sp.]|uniref:carbonic anhydrase n=1 Tax=Polynucleobacter sp. TaxID=2029855 RepID=UPI0027257820|nr:carbonic anhydrase [Polynucleobacter sp.]MDO8713741.1 carbonic anhydrase [Polynucleobacter sp.]
MNSRRNALKMFGAVSLLSMLEAKTVLAAGDKQPPILANVMTPDTALKRLTDGNKRYASGKSNIRDFSKTRVALAKGQNPYASILSCADSRVTPELCFDEGRGDLFVNRLAGNFVTPDILASIEYGSAVLGASVIMVLGHSECGAIKAAIDADKNHTDYPGHIQSITTALNPAVKAGLKNGGDLLNATTLENIKMNVAMLKDSAPLLRKLVQDKKLIVVGGLYHLDTGKVDLVA